MPYLFLLFIIMPIAEIAVLLQVGGAIGGWTTIGIVILTAILGTFMLRQQGMATLKKAQLRMQHGEMPAQQMIEGLLLLIGGVLLLTPGFITDFFGFCTLIPISRQFLARQLAKRSMSAGNIFVGGSAFGSNANVNSRQSSENDPRNRSQTQGPAGGQTGPANGKDRSKGDSSAIEGDYQRLD